MGDFVWTLHLHAPLPLPFSSSDCLVVTSQHENITFLFVDLILYIYFFTRKDFISFYCLIEKKCAISFVSQFPHLYQKFMSIIENIVLSSGDRTYVLSVIEFTFLYKTILKLQEYLLFKELFQSEDFIRFIIFFTLNLVT